MQVVDANPFAPQTFCSMSRRSAILGSFHSQHGEQWRRTLPQRVWIGKWAKRRRYERLVAPELRAADPVIGDVYNPDFSLFVAEEWFCGNCNYPALCWIREVGTRPDEPGCHRDGCRGAADYNDNTNNPDLPIKPPADFKGTWYNVRNNNILTNVQIWMTMLRQKKYTSLITTPWKQKTLAWRERARRRVRGLDPPLLGRS